MAEESSSSRKKESTVALTSSANSMRQNEDVDDLVKSPPHSPNNTSTRKIHANSDPLLGNPFFGRFNPLYLAATNNFIPTLCGSNLSAWSGLLCCSSELVSKKFMTGCVVIFPVAVTFFVTLWFIQFVDGFFSPIYERLGFDIFGLGFITSIIFIFFVGIFASSWLGATIFLIGEWFIKGMTFVKHIYSASKQISSAISPDQNTTAFKEIAIIRHPRIGEYALGFITSSVILQRDDGDEELCSVYVPTNHLYIGDIFLVNSEEIIRPNLSIREGIEIIVSVGMSMPQVISPMERIPRQNDQIRLDRMM